MIVGTSTNWSAVLRRRNVEERDDGHSTHRGAHRDVTERDLGHFDNLLGKQEEACRRNARHPAAVPPFAAQEHQESARRGRCPPSAPRSAAVPAPAAAPQREVSAVRGEESSGPWRRTTRLSTLPWPWLSSGPLGRYGASLQPGPWRRSSVHTASMHDRRVQLHQPPT